MKQTVHFGLEALRGIGIAGIGLYHFFPAEFPGGFLGVPLFFVLSGYLMFLTSEAQWKKGTFHIKTYYIKRIKKIYVPLFTLVVGVCSYLTLFRPEQLAGRRAERITLYPSVVSVVGNTILSLMASLVFALSQRLSNHP